MPAPAARKRDASPYRWASLGDEALLDLRLCDLKLTLADSPLASRIERLNDDLARKGLRFRPHCWLSSEWFSPDGVPGIALPFYLAHPRLIRLEARQMLAVEGKRENQCRRILRHEAGHCIDTAYRLHRRKRWRELFGSFTNPYPEHYRPRPGSRQYVTHLDAWYAQAHPAEDFAETFAVWLRAGDQWKRQYRGWPALRKLEYVDELMAQIADQPAPVRSRRKVDALSSQRQTLGQHYHDKRAHYATGCSDVYDRELSRLFSADPKHAGRPTAASFLRRHRREVREAVARWTPAHAYTIDQVLKDMINRCKQLRLRLAVPEPQARREAQIMVTVQTMHHLHAGHRWVAL